MKKVAVLGSGIVGEVLANGLLKHGYATMRASREPAKLEDWKKNAKGEASVGTFTEAAKWGDIVVLAIKGNAAEALVAELAPSLAGKTVIDSTNPIGDKPPVNGVLQYFTSMNESLMERLQKKAPDAHFVKAFNSVANSVMVNPKYDHPTMFICGNDANAKKDATEIVTKFGWEAFDMGAIEAARPIESLCMLYCIPGMTKNMWTHAWKLLR
jgi:predicted dinucleotide-binding enzyme